MSEMHNNKRIVTPAWWDSQFGKMVTYSDLLKDGWTAKSIQMKLGEPDCYGRNPRGGALVKLYSKTRTLDF